MKEMILENKWKPGHARGRRGRTAALLGGLVLALTLPGTGLKAQEPDITKSVLLSWPEPAEEQIVVGADSPTGPVWTPWPEPIFERFGQMCMAVPTTATQRYFKLVPGRQFADCFSDCSGPFTNRSPWVPLFQDPGEEWVVTNGVLQLKCNPPTVGTALCPLGTNGEAYLRDSYMSVDILDWVASGTTKSGFSLNARGRMVTPTAATSYMAGLTHNHDGIPGKVRSWIWNGSAFIRGTDFYLQDYPLPYRLQFSVVGTRLSLQVLSLTTGAPIGEPVVTTDWTYPDGFGVLYFSSSTAVPGDSVTVTVDNFLASGTKP